MAHDAQSVNEHISKLYIIKWIWHGNEVQAVSNSP